MVLMLIKKKGMIHNCRHYLPSSPSHSASSKLGNYSSKNLCCCQNLQDPVILVYFSLL